MNTLYSKLRAIVTFLFIFSLILLSSCAADTSQIKGITKKG